MRTFTSRGRSVLHMGISLCATLFWGCINEDPGRTNPLDATSSPYRIPRILEPISEPGRFIKGFRSQTTNSLLYVLDNDSATVRVLDITSNSFKQMRCSINGAVNIEDFSIATAADKEYILTINPGDFSFQRCIVEGETISISPDKLFLPHQPSAIATSSKNDSMVYVALHDIEQHFVHILKINFLTGNTVAAKSFPWTRVTFMTHQNNAVFILSDAATTVNVLDEALNEMASTVVGDFPKNISSASNTDLMFVCCLRSRQIYSIRREGSTLVSRNILNGENRDEDFIWVDSSEGVSCEEDRQESDILIFVLIHNQLEQRFRVEIYRTCDGVTLLTERNFLLSLEVPAEANVHGIDYIRDAAISNLYLFADNSIPYYVP